MVSEAFLARSVSSGLTDTPRIGSAFPARVGASEKAGDSAFGDLLRSTIGEVDKLEGQAHAAVEGLMRGTGVDVHQALIAAEKASASFELALALRNKAVQSYQSVMNMQF